MRSLLVATLAAALAPAPAAEDFVVDTFKSGPFDVTDTPSSGTFFSVQTGLSDSIGGRPRSARANS